MAKGASYYLLFFHFSILTVFSSGTLVGFTLSSSHADVIPFLKLNKVSPTQIRAAVVADQRVLSSLSKSGVSVDICLNESLAENLIHSESSAISWLKTYVVTFLPHVNIKSIILSSSGGKFTGKNGLPMILSTLKSLHSVISRIHLDREVKVSVAFSLSSLENLSTTHERDYLQRIFGFIKKIRSFLIIEASIDGELRMGDLFVQSMIKKAILPISSLPSNDVSIILTMKSPVVSNARDVDEFITKVSKSLENNIEIRGRIAELYVEVSSMDDFAEKELKREEEEEDIFPSFRRELDTFNPPTTILPTAPVTIPPEIPTPTIVTVPATNPVTITPANPGFTPLPIPSTTPVNVPPATPISPSLPLTNPATTPTPITVPGAQPITNPVTTYPAPAGNVPAGNVPVTTPVTNPVTPPAQTNAPAIPGQSWCVARTGASEASLQSALDYACGLGGADCSVIQQGGSCYNPDSLQNHASYAFNSYYQKNPVPSSCDFGGTAIIVNTNPSTGSCIYPSSSSSSSTSSTPTPSTPTPSTPTPTPTSTAPPVTTVSPLTGVPPGSVTPPTVLNSSNPASVFGSESPPVVNTSTSTSTSAGLQPFTGCFTLVTSIVTGLIILHI